MRASAEIVAEADGRGGTRLAILRGEAPLLLRRTAAATDTAVVHLIGGAAGPLGGDDLRLTVRVGPGATLEIRSVAASMALPHRSGARSTMRLRATVAAGATLRWLPEPLIAAAGCHHAAYTEVDVAAGGSLLWRDDVVCGRHGETPGDLVADSTVRYDGDTLYRHRLTLGPAAPGWSDAAVLGGGRAYGSIVLVDPSWSADVPPPARVLGPDAAVMPLVGPAMLATAVGADIRRVHAALDPLCRAPTLDPPVLDPPTLDPPTLDPRAAQLTRGASISSRADRPSTEPPSASRSVSDVVLPLASSAPSGYQARK